MGWQILDHTADMGIRVNAPDLASLFREAGHALVDIMGAGSTDGGEIQTISLEGIDREDLLVRWLQEILFLVMARDLRIKGIDVLDLTECRMQARVSGVRRKTSLEQEVKAVTYHDLQIVHRESLYEASIIFDL
jgi:SHS2 domain-containing protein